MTVYIDDMYLYPMGEFKRGHRLYKMSHMIADSEKELHAFATKLGLHKKWYQGDHYDVTKGLRGVAINLGAVEITLQQCSAMSMLRGRDPNVKLADPAQAEALWAEARPSRRQKVPA